METEDSELDRSFDLNFPQLKIAKAPKGTQLPRKQRQVAQSRSPPKQSSQSIRRNETPKSPKPNQKFLMRKQSVWVINDDSIEDEQARVKSMMGKFAYSKRMELQKKSELNQFNLGYKKLGIIQEKDINRIIENSSEDDEDEKEKQENQIFKDIHQRIISSSVKLNMIPLKMKFVDQKNDIAINMKGYQLGQHMKIFNEAMRSEEIKMIKKINIQNNEIKIEDFQNFLDTIPSLIKKLVFARCNLKEQGGILLGHDLNNNIPRYIALMDLNMKDNFLMDKGTCILLQGLMKLNVKKLNLSYNHITDESGEDIGRFINENREIREISLYWNKLMATTGLYIAGGISQNHGLAVLNLANNSLGRGRMNCGPKLIIAFNTKPNQSLRHVDLSYNYFQGLECITMGLELNNNKTLYGIHMEGNDNFYIDSLGFLKCSDRRKDQIIQNREPMTGVKIQHVQRYQDTRYSSFDNCWVCEGWTEQKFVFSLKQSSPKINQGPIFLHLDFMSFQLLEMVNDVNNPDMFFYIIMCPPDITVQYFFTSHIQGIVSVQQNQVKERILVPQTTYAEMYRVTDENGYTVDKMYSFKVPPIINQRKLFGTKQVMNAYYKELIVCRPRSYMPYSINSDIDNKQYFYKLVEKQRDIYEREVAVSYDKCFERDWKYMSVGNFVKNKDDLEGVKQCMKDSYKNILNSFKILSSSGGLADIMFTVGCNILTQWFTQCGVIDKKLLTMNDFDINYIASNHSSLKNPLTRFQFVEFIIRIASEKYIKNGICQTFTEAVNLLLKSGLGEVFDDCEDPQVWRNHRYWKQEVDDFIMERQDFLRHLYKFFSGTIRKIGQNFANSNFISLHEFRAIFEHYELLGDNLQERDVLKAFTFSQEPVENDKDPEKQIMLCFEEFVEAIGRVAEQVSMVPYGEIPSEWYNEVRINQTLLVKYKNLCDYLENFEFIKMQGQNADLFGGEQYYSGLEKHEIQLDKISKQTLDKLFKKGKNDTPMGGSFAGSGSVYDKSPTGSIQGSSVYDSERMMSPKSPLGSPGTLKRNMNQRRKGQAISIQKKEENKSNGKPKKINKMVQMMLNPTNTIEKEVLSQEQQLINLIKKERPDLKDIAKLTVKDLLAIAKDNPRIREQMIIEDVDTTDEKRMKMVQTELKLTLMPDVLDMRTQEQLREVERQRRRAGEYKVLKKGDKGYLLDLANNLVADVQV